MKKIYRNLFGVISIKNIENDIILIFPNYKFFLSKKMYQKKIYKNLLKILYLKNINYVVLSKKLKNNIKLKNVLYSQNLNILDGKLLFEIMILDCLKYITDIQKINLNSIEITMLVNNISKNTIDNLILLANNVRAINIVTNNINKFRKIEEKIRNKFGIMIRISNNKRKSLQNTKIIFNIDFPEELINKYTINPDAIIININKKIKLNNKFFNGINIQDFNIIMQSEKMTKLKIALQKCSFIDKEIYESIVIKEKNIYESRKHLIEDRAKIVNLVGNNGIINKKEYVKFK